MLQFTTIFFIGYKRNNETIKEMSVKVIEQKEKSIILQIEINYDGDMKSAEMSIAQAGQAVCLKSYESLLKSFDTNGEPIVVDNVKMTSKGLCPKTYQTLYGEVAVERHVYQSARGGAHYCPLEDKARIILTSTPDFAEIVAHKSAEMPAESVVTDLMISNKRKVVKNVVQRISKEVAEGVQATESKWTYDTPPEKEEVATIGIGLDGASVLMTTGDWRMAMVGTIALYDKEGKRLHTSYRAASPEHGKEKFKFHFAHDIEHIIALYPSAKRIGIADGAADNWTFLEKYTTTQTLDFYHATEYLSKVADCLFNSNELRKKWLDNRCHQLKHFEGAPEDLLAEVMNFNEHVLQKTEPKEMKFRKKTIPPIPKSQTDNKDCMEDIVAETIELSKPFKSKIDRKALEDFISYFKNNIAKSRMNYAQNMTEKMPIGSGITEAACKTIIKQRLCQSGMRWGNEGMDDILVLRTLAKSDGKWDQFWAKVRECGFPKV